MTDTIIASPVKITASAIKQLRRIKEEQQLDDSHCLRVGVKGGGCSGFTYVLGFDVKKEKDQVFQIDDMNVVWKKHMESTSLEWRSTGMRASIIVDLPSITQMLQSPVAVERVSLPRLRF